MGRLCLFTIFCASVSVISAQDVFFHGARPYIVLPPRRMPSSPSFSAELADIGRSGQLDLSSEEEEDSNEERVIIKNSTTKSFVEVAPLPVTKIPLPRKPAPPKAPPAQKQSVSDTSSDDSPLSAFRFLWPFQVSVTKTKGEPHHHAHHDDFGYYPIDLYHHHHLHHGHKKTYHPLATEFKGLSKKDIKILNSKGYRKFQNKRKKKLKKVKKKLKFKRAMQKILDKKIKYYDKLAPDGWY